MDLRELDREREPEKKFTIPVGAIWGGTPMLPRPRRDGEKILPLTHTPKIEGGHPLKIICPIPLALVFQGWSRRQDMRANIGNRARAYAPHAREVGNGGRIRARNAVRYISKPRFASQSRVSGSTVGVNPRFAS